MYLYMYCVYTCTYAFSALVYIHWNLHVYSLYTWNVCICIQTHTHTHAHFRFEFCFFRFECLMAVSFHLIHDRNILWVYIALFLKESLGQHSSSSSRIIHWWLIRNLPDQQNGEDSLGVRRSHGNLPVITI